MRPLLACALAAAVLVAGAAPAAGAWSSVTDRNVAWLLDAAGLDGLPEGDATLHENGAAGIVPAAVAVRRAAERFGDVDAARLAASATESDEPWGVGDVWVIEMGWADRCSEVQQTILARNVLPASAFHPQLTTYGGVVGVAEMEGGYWRLSGLIVDWTTKGAHGGHYTSGRLHFGGQYDFFCVTYFGLYLLMPQIDGYARVFDDPPH